MNHLLTTTLALLISTSAFAGETNPGPYLSKSSPPPEESWEFKLSLPGWIPWVAGDAGLNGKTTNVDLDPSDIIPRLDMVADVRMEARKGRFSVMGEFLYMSLSDGIGTKTVVKKLDVQVDQTMGDLGFGWRVIDTPRGWLDVTAGVRYVNLYQKITIQPNDGRINEVVDSLANAAGAQLRERVEQALVALEGKDPTVPIAPLGSGKIARLAREIANIKGTSAERRAKIAQRLHDALDTTVSRTDDWFDPYVGLRGRYNLNDKFYLTAKGDIGGFGVGCDVTWTAEAALGVQLTQHVFIEAGFRAWGLDYDQDGLVMDTVTYGPQVSLGVQF